MIKKLFLILLIAAIFTQCRREESARNTGWASYTETTFTRDNPKEVKKGEIYYLQWENVDSITTERPSDIDTWIRNNKFSPKDIGAGFIIRIDLDLKSSTPSNNIAELQIDIGDENPIVIQRRILAMPNDQWLPESKTIGLYSLETFQKNGAKIGVRATGQDFSIGGYTMVIWRIHQATQEQ